MGGRGIFKAGALFFEKDSDGDSKNGILYPSFKTFKISELAPISFQKLIFFASLPLTFLLDMVNSCSCNSKYCLCE